MNRRLYRLLLWLLPAMLLITGCREGSGASSGAASSPPTHAASSGGSTAAPSAGPDPSPEGELTVTVFQTGKSDCILIETAGGAALIDTADKGDGKELVQELEKRGVRKLELLLLTHLDKDHIGGAARILENFPVERLVQADYDEDSGPYEKYQEACAALGLTPLRLREEMTLTLGGASLTLTPGAHPPYEQDNDYSIITAMEYGEIRFLFAGDAEKERLGEFLSSGGGPADFLKVPHHGRYNGLSAAFLDAVRPAWAVITCSEKEPPEEELLELLRRGGAKTLLTSGGPVTAVSDGKTLAVTQG